MDITISENLKKLRREKGNTQEALADFLAISIPAVSKWERGEGYPDITLLPAIAEFYEVSVDDLLGVGAAKKQEKIDRYTQTAMEHLKAGRTGDAVSVWREMYAEFPNNYEVIGGLAYAIYYDYNGTRKNKDCLREVIALENRILEESTVQYLRDMAIERLCYSYSMLGETEKAKECAEKASSINSSKEILTANILTGEERTKSSQSLIIQLIVILQNAIYHVESVDWLTRHKLVLGLCDLFFGSDGGSVGGLSGNAANAHYYCARIYAGCDGEDEKVRRHIEKLAECVKCCNNDGSAQKYGGEIFKDYSDANSTVIKSGEESLGEFYSRMISPAESPMFDRFRDEKWFKKAEAALKASK